MVSTRAAALAVIVVLLAAATVGFVVMRPGPASTSTIASGSTSSSSGPTETSSSAAGESTVVSTSPTEATTASRASSTGTTTSSSSSEMPQSPKGVTFSPATYDGAGIADFLSKAPQTGQILEWAGDWMELGGDGAPATISGLASQQGMKMMVVVQFFQQSTGELLRPLNSTNELEYLALTKDFVQQHKPSYLGVGIEVDILYQKNRTSFQEFVSLYNQVYDEVKSVSPETLVFTIFQYEKMNGLDGGLYGGINDANNTEWQLLSLFRTDVAAFTTYPGLIYHDPSDIPGDYYGRVALHVNESVGFTEIGWHTGNVSGGWGSSQEEQAAFVSRFFALTKGLNRAFVVWSFLYDQAAVVPFNTMGLFYVNGTAKLAWQTWLSEP